jgi:hypothetical protein
MQIMLVVIVIFVPQSVTAFLDKAEVVDLDKVVIEVPAEEADAKPEDEPDPLRNLQSQTTDKK